MARGKKFDPPYDGLEALGAKHVRLHETLLRTDAWNALSSVAKVMLIELMRLHNGRNNGDIVLSVRAAAARVGCAINTAHRALKDLQEKGFLKLVSRGYFGLGEREATTWRLTMLGTPSNRRPTAEFMSWKAEQKEEKETKPQSQKLRRPVSVSETGKTMSVSEFETDSVNNCDGTASSKTLSGPINGDTIRLPLGATLLGSDLDMDELRKATREWLDWQPRGAGAVLARKVNITPGHLSNFLGGRCNLSTGVARRLRDAVAGPRS